MKVYLLKRIAVAFTTLFFLASILFVIFRLVPGDPTMTVLSDAINLEVQKELRHRFGLDKSLFEQYVLYMGNLLKWNLGVSFTYGKKVSDIVGGRFWNTIFLMVPSLAFAYIFGALTGAYIAWRRGSKTEISIIVSSIVFRSGPVFWVAIMFVYLFAVKIPIFPIGHMRTPGSVGSAGIGIFFSLDFLYHLILPMVMMALYYGCYPLLIMRTSMLEVLGEDFIDLSKAKGLSEKKVIYKHAMRNSLLPLVTSISVLGAFAVGGSVLIESVFSWPGLGRLMVTAVMNSDYPLAQAAFLLIGITVVLANLVADLLYGILDPRIRYA
jgi:peptide/nickel transport system permease protein